jgi:opacity protein-like surface antigen
MTNRNKQHRLNAMKLRHLVTIFILLTSVQSFANFKLDTLFGYYSLKAETNAASGSLSALGLYTFHVRKSFVPKFDFGIGYTLQMSKSFFGDVSYGPDLGFYYFPISNATPLVAENASTNFVLQEKYKPYVGLNFHQRNYQAAKSSYAGFSLIAGCEFDVGYSFLINTQFRYLSLDGPQDSKAKDINFLGGLTFWF